MMSIDIVAEYCLKIKKSIDERDNKPEERSITNPRNEPMSQGFSTPLMNTDLSRKRKCISPFKLKDHNGNLIMHLNEAETEMENNRFDETISSVSDLDFNSQKCKKDESQIEFKGTKKDGRIESQISGREKIEWFIAFIIIFVAFVGIRQCVFSVEIN